MPWPSNEPVQFNGGQLCDMWIGPCACGATHGFEERQDGRDKRAAKLAVRRALREGK
jgi:hypothetical protein